MLAAPAGALSRAKALAVRAAAARAVGAKALAVRAVRAKAAELAKDIKGQLSTVKTLKEGGYVSFCQLGVAKKNARIENVEIMFRPQKAKVEVEEAARAKAEKAAEARKKALGRSLVQPAVHCRTNDYFVSY